MVTWGIAELLMGNRRFRPRDRCAGRVEALMVPGLGFPVASVAELLAEHPGTDGGSRCGFTGDVRCGRRPAHRAAGHPGNYSPLDWLAAIAGTDGVRITSVPSCRRARKRPPA